MEKNITKAINDLSIIKNYIEHSKNKKPKLQKMFLLFAIINFSYFVITTLEHILVPRIEILGYVNSLISLVIYIIGFICFVRIKNNKENSINKYYLIFFNVCGFIFLVLPIVFMGLRLILIKNNFDIDIGNSLVKMQFLTMFFNIVLLSFCMNIIGYFSEKKLLRFISLIVLIVFITLSILYSNKSLILANASISIVGLYYYLIVSIGYSSLAFITSYKEKKNNECK